MVLLPLDLIIVVDPRQIQCLLELRVLLCLLYIWSTTHLGFIHSFLHKISAFFWGLCDSYHTLLYFGITVRKGLLVAHGVLMLQRHLGRAAYSARHCERKGVDWFNRLLFGRF